MCLKCLITHMKALQETQAIQLARQDDESQAPGPTAHFLVKILLAG